MAHAQLCLAVVELCKEVGAFIREERTRFQADQIEEKGLHDLVSYVDKTAELRLVEKLGLFLPEAGFITEEKTIQKVSDTYNWIIDPLDGTTNFIHGIPVYSISIALYHQQTAVVGVVYEIGQDECFYAWKDGGAFLNGKAIAVSTTFSLGKSLLATGFPYTNFKGMEAYLSVLRTAMQSTRGVRRMGSAAVDLAYVACGRFDAFFEYNLNAWDVAAGAFIVQEAGGKVMNFSGGTEFIDCRQILALNSALETEMKLMVQPLAEA